MSGYPPQPTWSPDSRAVTAQGQPQQQQTQQQHQQQGWSPVPQNNGPYTPGQNHQQPLPSMNQPPGPMPTLQPQHPEQYRAMLPPPNQMYAPQGYAPQAPMPYPQQPAPRQRTAIACKYCRRRKIRCSGFDQNEDGKCTNCQRFGIECLFAPVSASSHAFVPAHAVFGRNQPPPNSQLYGAFGQPLPQQYDPRVGYPPQQQQQQQQPQQGQYPPPPQGYQQPGMYPQPPQGTPQGPSSDAGRKRGNDEPQTPTLPPPQRDGGYSYPDPSGLTPAGASPASSHSSFHSTALAQPYHAQQMSVSRASSSPNNQGFVESAGPPPPSMPFYDGHQLMAHANGHGQRQAGNANDVIGPAMNQYSAQQQATMKLDERTSADSSKEAEGMPNIQGGDKMDVRLRFGSYSDAATQTAITHTEVMVSSKEQAS